jgi:hypothetical protein
MPPTPKRARLEIPTCDMLEAALKGILSTNVGASTTPAPSPLLDLSTAPLTAIRGLTIGGSFALPSPGQQTTTMWLARSKTNYLVVCLHCGVYWLVIGSGLSSSAEATTLATSDPVIVMREKNPLAAVLVEDDDIHNRFVASSLAALMQSCADRDNDNDDDDDQVVRPTPLSTEIRIIMT